MRQRARVFAWLVPLMLVGVALAVRIYRLDAQSLWLDEGSSWQMSSQSWGTLLGDLLSPTAAYPLYHLLLKLWISLFGDSEIALRLPSAIAGTMAVPVIYLAAQEGSRESESLLPPLLYPLAAALIALIGPFPLWYAQEAKAYSLLLLAAALLTWTLLRALRTGSRRDWLAFVVVALIAVCIHRLAALSVVAGGWAWWVGGREAGGRRKEAGSRRPASCLLPPASCLLPPAPWAAMGLILMSAGLVAVMIYGLGSDRAATGAYIPAGPLAALGLTFTRFSLDRWPGDVPWWWLLPWAILLAWGLIRLSLDVWRESKIRSAPLAILCLLLVPLGLFLIQLLFTHLYEARYLIVIYPVWTLVVAYPLAGGRRQEAGGRRQEAGG
ncbi:MAG: glycosyltransferase family 39 protein, partial [Chloroflexales bacterium]